MRSKGKAIEVVEDGVIFFTQIMSLSFVLQDGLTPLHCAARSGHENVVDTLLIRGAPYQAKTKVSNSSKLPVRPRLRYITLTGQPIRQGVGCRTLVQ